MIALRALEDLGPSDQDPELRAPAGPDHQRGRRRQPERTRARDDEHGDGGREGVRRIAGEREPAGERRERQAEHDGDEDRGDAVGEALDRRLARLRLLDEPGDLRERGVGADPRRADDEPAVRVDRRPGDLDAGTDVDGHGLARQHRRVDCREAVLHDAVGRDLLARADDEPVAGPDPVDGNHDLLPVAQQPCVLRAELEERADRCACATARPRLQESPEEDQRRDHRADLEVRVGVVDRGECHHRPRPGRERPDRDERVHRRGPVARVRHRRAVERPAGPEDDGGREREGEPLPPVEVESGDHRERCERSGERGRDGESCPQRLRPLVGGFGACLEVGAVSGRLDRVDEIGDRGPARVVGDARLLGSEVDGRLDAVQLVQRPLDSRHAARARHPLDGEADACARLKLGDRGHDVTIIPQGGTRPCRAKALPRIAWCLRS